jgi:hypothetical protein
MNKWVKSHYFDLGSVAKFWIKLISQWLEDKAVLQPDIQFKKYSVINCLLGNILESDVYMKE